MKIFNKDFFIDLKKCILWQYDKAKNLSKLITEKENWYKENVSDVIVKFWQNVCNIETADDFGLSIWGYILNFSRYINYSTGTVHYLTTEEYRFLLKAQMLRFKCSGTVPEINEFLYRLFEDEAHQCYVTDNQDMTMTYVLQKDFSDKQWLLDWLLDPSQEYLDWLPRPAGVRITIVTDYNDYFGFDGSELEGFDNGILLN